MITKREQELSYRYAYRFLAGLERPNPGSGDQLTRRLRRADGELVTTLDEFVRAAMEGKLIDPPRPEWLGEM